MTLAERIAGLDDEQQKVVDKIRAEFRAGGLPVKAATEGSGMDSLPKLIAVGLTNEVLRNLEERIVALEEERGA